MNTKLFVLFILMVNVILTGFAQEKIKVEITQKKMSEGNQLAFTVLIPEATELGMVQKEWKKFTNKETILKHIANTDEINFLHISTESKKEKKALVKQVGKVENRGSELVVKNFLLEENSGKHVDVISLLELVDSGVFVSSFFKYGEDLFVDKSSMEEDVEAALSSYMKTFGVEAYKEVVEEQVGAEEKKLKEQENILQGLERENKNLHKSIEKSNEDIAELNTEIKSLDAGNKLIAESLGSIGESLAGMTETSFDYDLTKKNEKEKLKEKKKNDKRIASNKTKIKKNENNISESKSQIEENLETQTNQKQVISDQEKVVVQFETKLSNIK